MKVMKKKAAMKAMKVMKKKAAMKAMKAMKKKAVSKIATGSHAKAMVLRGTKAKTTGGLTASDLIRNKAGKIVSKKKSATAKKAFKNSGAMVPGPGQGPQGLEDHGLRRGQEGHAALRESQGTLQPVSASLIL